MHRRTKRRLSKRRRPIPRVTSLKIRACDQLTKRYPPHFKVKGDGTKVLVLPLISQ
jgi:hypothetical protein